MQYMKFNQGLSIIAATLVALFACGFTAVHAETPVVRGPGAGVCDGTGPGGGEPRLDGRGQGEGQYRLGRGGDGRGMPRAERGDGRGTPRLDGRGPRHEDAPRHGIGRTGEGRFGGGECGGERLQDGSGRGSGQQSGQMNRYRRGANEGNRANRPGR